MFVWLEGNLTRKESGETGKEEEKNETHHIALISNFEKDNIL